MAKTSKMPKRGEIWLVKFKKAKENPKFFRPCLVISSDIQNEFNDLIAIVPITMIILRQLNPLKFLLKTLWKPA